jgi:hypothetical protein
MSTPQYFRLFESNRKANLIKKKKTVCNILAFYNDILPLGVRDK